MTRAGRRGVLLDEMLSAAIAAQLRNRGIDALAVVEDPALVSMPDDLLLDHAAREGRVLVTANIADFTLLASDWRTEGRAHAGLVHVAFRAFPQNRSFIGKVTESLSALCTAGGLPGPGEEVFL